MRVEAPPDMALSGTGINASLELCASAGDLKSLHHVLQTPARDFKSISGTRIMWLLVPFFLSKFVSEVAAAFDELRKEGASVCSPARGDPAPARAPSASRYRWFRCRARRRP